MRAHSLACQFTKISATGTPSILPGVGGIAHNVRVGDPACGWEADHVEPCVSTENKENDARRGQIANTAFNILSGVGNEATVVTGDVKGSKGVVTGKHGDIEHVLLDFQPLNPKPSGKKLDVPVVHMIPATIMGSGLGANQVFSGDYDIQLFDEKVIVR